ncbi:MAG: hypothetical protein ACYS8W_09840 [Planctomycetota bacterium]|jgi:hypothetical protein
MLLALFVLLVGALIAAFNLASGYVFGNIFGYSIALWGSILGTMFFSLGLAVLITGPLSRRARGRRFVCFLAFVSGVMIFTLAFLEPKMAIEFMGSALREEYKPMLAAVTLLFLPNFLMSMIIPVTGGIAIRGKRPKPEPADASPETPEPPAAAPSPTDSGGEKAISVDAIPASGIKVLEVERSGTHNVSKSDIKKRIAGNKRAIPAQPAVLDEVTEAAIRYKLLRRHEALALFGFALGSFSTLIAVVVTKDPWLILTAVGMILLFISFFGAAFIVKSFVTASIVAHFVLSSTVFIELAPSPGFIDRVLAAEAAEMKKAEEKDFATDGRKVKRLPSEKVRELFHKISTEIADAPDKSIAIPLLFDTIYELGPVIIHGDDVRMVADELFKDPYYRNCVMPFANDIKYVKRKMDSDEIVVSVRRHRDGSNVTVFVPRIDGSTLKLIVTQSFTVRLTREGAATIIDFGPPIRKSIMSKDFITPLKAIDVVGPFDAILFSLKILEREKDVVLLATGQGPIGGRVEVEVASVSKDLEDAWTR